MELEGKRIIQVDIEKEMKKSYLDYSMSVIVGRALPDVRDGLKPVHRRILYTMHENGLTPEKAYRKCADTVGSVLGRYHPHGDASVYDALVRMAQDFSLRYMLVDGHGNFGSVDGDPPAAYRYTEARMGKLAIPMLTDIEKETVNFLPNYDDRLKEPEVLPSRFPNLLANGSTGIAVGMATNIPPHNLGEGIDAMCLLIDNPEATLNDLMECIQGPDFPTGGVIMGRSGIRAAYGTGRGRILVRAKAEIAQTHTGRYQIIVTELPYQVNKARLIENIADLVKEKRIEGISNRHRPETGSQSPSGAKPALPLYPDAGNLWGNYAGVGGRAAQGHDPQGDAGTLHQVPGGGHHPAYPVRLEKGPGTGPYLRSPLQGAGLYRRSGGHSQNLTQHCRRQAAVDGPG